MHKNEIMFPVSQSNPYSIVNALANFDPKEEERKRKIMENCQMAEFEQDMGKTIPFCKMDGKPCNLQCENRRAET